MNGMTMKAEVDLSTTATAGSGEDEERLSARAIASAKAGDKSAFHYLYTRYADDVYRYVNGIVRHHAQAEDITQNVFLKLMTAIHRYEQREVPFKAWIFRVARNAAFDYMRGNRRLVPCEEIFASDEASVEAGADCWQMVEHGLDELPDDQREVLVLRHIVGLSPGEIGEVLDKTEGSIHGLHHRGRATMQTALRRLGAEPVTAAAPPVTAVA